MRRLKKRYQRKPRIHRKRTLRGSGTNDFRHREASSSSSYFFSSSSSEKNRQEEDCVVVVVVVVVTIQSDFVRGDGFL